MCQWIIQQIQRKENIPENLTPKFQQQKLGKQKITSKKYILFIFLEDNS